MARKRESTERTLNGAVFERIRSDILAGRILPGSRLKLAGLCDHHDVSLSVVREALTRLSEQGLVVSEPQIGFRVTPLSRDDLIDLNATRRQIEGLALREAITHGDVSWEASVVAAHHTLARTAQFVDGAQTQTSEEWFVVHAAFHRTLVGGCGRPRLLGLIESLWDASELYRRWSSTVQRDRDVPAEHTAILDAVLHRDADEAVELLNTHTARTLEVLLEGFDEAIPAPSAAG